MSSVHTTAMSGNDLSHSDEYGMQHLVPELMLQICGYLDIHDQQAMKRVWVSSLWKTNLSRTFLSRYVHLDGSNFLAQSKNHEKNGDEPMSARLYRHRLGLVTLHLLEHALHVHLGMNTKVLLLRHMPWDPEGQNIVNRVLRQKATHLRRVLPMVCVVQRDLATIVNSDFPDRVNHTKVYYAPKEFIWEPVDLGYRFTRLESVSCKYLGETACSKWSVSPSADRP